MATQINDFRDLLTKLGSLDAVAARGVKPGLYKNLPPIEALPRFSLNTTHKDVEDVLYVPTLALRPFHASRKPNCLLHGGRGGGKSHGLRYDFHMRAVTIPDFPYLIVRRTMPELRRSHLMFLTREMAKLGGKFNKTEATCYYPNGSIGFYGYVEHESDLERYLGNQYGAVGIDEITTFPWAFVSKLAACLRNAEEAGYMSVLRAGTNPIGIGANDVKRYFINKDVDREIDPDYFPEDYEDIPVQLTDNPHLDQIAYIRRLKGSGIPEHIRRAWIDGIWLNEGAYFLDFYPTKDGVPWHVIKEMPTYRGESVITNVHQKPWIHIYRAIDWGYSPDPAVCLWIMVLPDGREIVFKERSWRHTIAADVAAAIKRESEGMQIRETFADPSMFAKRGETMYSVGEIFENHGIPITESINDRALFGYSIHDHLNTFIYEGGEESEDRMQRPKLQILDEQRNHVLGCPDLIRNFGEVRTDPKDPKKLAEGEDHHVVALAYYCTGGAPTPRDIEHYGIQRWRLPPSKQRFRPAPVEDP